MIEEPKTWIGLIGVLLVVVGPIITTIISSRRVQSRADKRASKIVDQADSIRDRVDSLHNQVVNGHGNKPLRDDVDRVIKTGDQTHNLLLDTHRMLTDHNSHILRLGDKVNDHGNQIAALTNEVNDLGGKVDKVVKKATKEEESD